MKAFSVSKAHKTQLCLSRKIIQEDRLPKHVRTVAGVDVAYFENFAVGAAVVLEYDTLDTLEKQVAVCETKIPYIPTLLSFREIPPAMTAIKLLKLQPDLFLVDAQGFAHPYRCGFASHLGLILGKPTIGVAKNRLIGVPVERNGETLLIHKGEVIGEAVTTKHGAKPIYVSTGHMVSLKTAVKIAKHCAKGRIPEPTLRAHTLATQEKNRLLSQSKVNIKET
jgi:deoxyribonuclease V